MREFELWSIRLKHVTWSQFLRWYRFNWLPLSRELDETYELRWRLNEEIQRASLSFDFLCAHACGTCYRSTRQTFIDCVGCVTKPAIPIARAYRVPLLLLHHHHHHHQQHQPLQHHFYLFHCHTCLSIFICVCVCVFLFSAFDLFSILPLLRATTTVTTRVRKQNTFSRVPILYTNTMHQARVLSPVTL